MPCNFEVNLITRLGVIALFSSFFSSPDPKGHVRYCQTKLGSKHLCKVLYKVSPFSPFGLQTWPPRLILFSDWLMLKKIFSSETAWPNGAKLGIDGPWVCPFQNCVRQPHPPFKMAAVF